MKLSDKFNAFVESTPIPLKKVKAEELSDIGVRCTVKNITECLFEKGVSAGSPIFKGSKVTFMGAYSYINGGGYIRSNVFIGRFCSIGRRVTIGAGRHNMKGLTTSPIIGNGDATAYTKRQLQSLGFSQAPCRNTVIMNDVWIGDGAVIMPGTIIHSGAVIGANAVVTKDVPHYAIVGGCPARIIRSRFPAAVIELLLQTEWWEIPLEILEKMPTGNIYQFIENIAVIHPTESDNLLTYELHSEI